MFGYGGRWYGYGVWLAIRCAWFALIIVLFILLIIIGAVVWN